VGRTFVGARCIFGARTPFRAGHGVSYKALQAPRAPTAANCWRDPAWGLMMQPGVSRHGGRCVGQSQSGECAELGRRSLGMAVPRFL
jgi:hypothetical protein